jgi:hypothetical protein
LDPNEFDHRYSRDDMLELVGAQAFSLIIMTFAAIACGGAWFDAVLAHNQPLNYRYERIASVALGAFALYNAISIPARYSFIWSAAKARRRIASCLLQVAATGLIIAIAGIVLARFRINLGSGQSIYVWAAYGVLAGGILHALSALCAFALLMTGRELPDIES